MVFSKSFLNYDLDSQAVAVPGRSGESFFAAFEDAPHATSSEIFANDIQESFDTFDLSIENSGNDFNVDCNCRRTSSD